MSVEQVVNFMWDVLEKAVDIGKYALTWFVSDITIGTWTFKPLYIAAGTYFAMLTAMLIIKIVRAVE